MGDHRLSLLTANKVERAVRLGCERFGVEMMRTLEPPAPQGRMMGASSRGWISGPANASLFKEGPIEKVWMGGTQRPGAENWMAALHELEHLVFWHPERGAKIPEHLMMPFGAGLLTCVGLHPSAYFDSDYVALSVLPHAENSGHVGTLEVANWDKPEHSGWYRKAFDACVAAGVLTAAGVPTWTRPVWSAIDLASHEFVDVDYAR